MSDFQWYTDLEQVFVALRDRVRPLPQQLAAERAVHGQDVATIQRLRRELHTVQAAREAEVHTFRAQLGNAVLQRFVSRLNTEEFIVFVSSGGYLLGATPPPSQELHLPRENLFSVLDAKPDLYATVGGMLHRRAESNDGQGEYGTQRKMGMLDEMGMGFGSRGTGSNEAQATKRPSTT